MNENRIEIAKLLADCNRKSIQCTNDCFFPGCSEKSINSHILQKNGILSSIAKEKHLWEFKVDHFKEPYIHFNRNGINKIYTFPGFCLHHDTSLFKKIENGDILFDDYETHLLFALRTLYNEMWLKIIAIKNYKCVLNNPDFLVDKFSLEQAVEQSNIGLKDLSFFENFVWKDLSEKTRSFTFQFRELDKQEICMTGLFTYDTTQEISNSIVYDNKDIDRLSEIFISFFPYKNKSILMMGYHNDDKAKVKGFVNQFFSENQKRVYRKLTNMILLHCETWVCSDKFYEEKIKGVEDDFFKASLFASNLGNERKVFDLNIFLPNFKTKFSTWVKQYVG